MPIVDTFFSLYFPIINFLKRKVFPTDESPIMAILYINASASIPLLGGLPFIKFIYFNFLY